MAGDSEVPFWIEGQPKPATESDMPTALFYGVQPGYLKTTRIPLVRGRFLTSQDNEHSPQVIVIDQQFARLYFHGQNPIGQRVHFELLGTTPEIVGIVGHVKQWGLDRDATNKVQAQFYFPISQVPDGLMPLLARGSVVVVRTANSPQAAVARDGTIYVGTEAGLFAVRDDGTSGAVKPGWPFATVGGVDAVWQTSTFAGDKNFAGGAFWAGSRDEQWKKVDEAIGKGLPKGTEEIDARGKIVTPGFVDVHTHYDAQICWDGAVTPSSWHGVTSVVMGNCGVGIAPCKPASREVVVRIFQAVADAMIVVIRWVLKAAPLGVFALVVGGLLEHAGDPLVAVLAGPLG